MHTQVFRSVLSAEAHTFYQVTVVLNIYKLSLKTRKSQDQVGRHKLLWSTSQVGCCIFALQYKADVAVI